MGLPEGVRIEALRREWVRGALLVKNAGWWEAYLPWLGEEYLRRMDAGLERGVAGWTRALDAGSLMPTWVALTADDTVVGVGAGGPVEALEAIEGRLAGERAPGVTHELGVLYVEAAWRGRGIAEALTAAAIGEHPSHLWVLEENPRAQAFYAKAGFVADGGMEDLPAEWNGAREIRMVRA
ncbi:MAG: GNAT family N-acetyltransferase [Arthrobacter sp.]|jgi:GNAT superfamily N-acetyltransferase|nr:GNAT family N-acetyltransferase [Arthrobacter sp.]